MRPSRLVPKHCRSTGSAVPGKGSGSGTSLARGVGGLQRVSRSTLASSSESIPAAKQRQSPLPVAKSYESALKDSNPTLPLGFTEVCRTLHITEPWFICKVENPHLVVV